MSIDNRLVMEQWAVPGDCQKPTMTRVTDRLLGFTCLQETMEVVNCYAPDHFSQAMAAGPLTLPNTSAASISA